MNLRLLFTDARDYFAEIAGEVRGVFRNAPLRRIDGFVQRQRSDIITCLLLFIAFATLYFCVAYQFMQAGILYPNDSLYGWDTARVVDDMVVRGSNQRSNVHPLFVLFVKPFGLLLNGGLGLSKHGSAIGLSAGAMSMGVVLAFAFFRFWKVRRAEATLFAAFYGFTLIGMFSGIVPETGVFAICALTLAMGLAAMSLSLGMRSEAAWLLSGVFTYGITISNVVKNVDAFGFSSWRQGAFLLALRRTIFYMLITCAAGATLTWAVGSSFNLMADKWIATPSMRQGSIHNIGSELVHNFLFYDVIGPDPSMQLVDFPPDLVQARIVTFNESHYSGAQMGLAAVWILMFAGSFAAVLARRDGAELRMAATLGFMLVWDFAFFSRYYVPFEGLLHWSAHVIPAVFLPLVFLARRMSDLKPGPRAAALAGLAVFVGLVGWNNWNVVWKSLAIWLG